MQSLISVTPYEFKRHFDKIMEVATDTCMTIDREIIIAIPEKKDSHVYVEVAKITPVDGGAKYEYNREHLKKFGITTDSKINRIEAIIADAFEKAGIAEYARKNKEAASKLQEAMIIAAKELIKQYKI